MKHDTYLPLMAVNNTLISQNDLFDSNELPKMMILGICSGKHTWKEKFSESFFLASMFPLHTSFAINHCQFIVIDNI